MFQTATVTDLRFKTKEIMAKGEADPVFVFKKGKKKGVYLGAQLWEKLLSRDKKAPTRIPKNNPSLLDEIKKYQINGPKDLSLTIDKYLYGSK